MAGTGLVEIEFVNAIVAGEEGEGLVQGVLKLALLIPDAKCSPAASCIIHAPKQT